MGGGVSSSAAGLLRLVLVERGIFWPDVMLEGIWMVLRVLVNYGVGWGTKIRRVEQRLKLAEDEKGKNHQLSDASHESGCGGRREVIQGSLSV